MTAVAAAALGASGLVAREVTWTAGRPPAPGTPVAVRIRHRHTPTPARVVPVPPAEVHVRFDRPGPAVTPGQAAVFYRGELVLGGGWIAEAIQ